MFLLLSAGLRQPLESGEVIIARANHRVTYPARFQLVAAMNPCRCGRATEPGYACKKAPNETCMAHYQSRISGPFLDRVDLVIAVPAVSASDLMTPGASEPSASVARRVNRARKLQTQRYQELGLGEITSNAGCPVGRITEIAALDDASLSLLRSAADAMKLTARGYHRVLKVARTIADLDGHESLRRIHLAEALSYRSRDMMAR